MAIIEKVGLGKFRGSFGQRLIASISLDDSLICLRAARPHRERSMFGLLDYQSRKHAAEPFCPGVLPIVCL